MTCTVNLRISCRKPNQPKDSDFPSIRKSKRRPGRELSWIYGNSLASVFREWLSLCLFLFSYSFPVSFSFLFSSLFISLSLSLPFSLLFLFLFSLFFFSFSTVRGSVAGSVAQLLATCVLEARTCAVLRVCKFRMRMVGRKVCLSHGRI